MKACRRFATSACRCRSTSRSPTPCPRPCGIACDPGCRLLVPFGPRKLTGVVLRCHDRAPRRSPRATPCACIDSEPVLDAELLALGRWIAAYYCSPLGDVLRGMLPLASEIRRGKIWSLTDAGRDAARQLLLDSSPDDPVAQVLRMLEKRPLSAAYLAKSLPLADKAIRSLERKRFIVAEAGADRARSPARARRTSARGTGRPPPPASPHRLNKPERELRAFLELHPGSHNLKELEDADPQRQPRRRARWPAKAGFAQARARVR